MNLATPIFSKSFYREFLRVTAVVVVMLAAAVLPITVSEGASFATVSGHNSPAVTTTSTVSASAKPFNAQRGASGVNTLVPRTSTAPSVAPSWTDYEVNTTLNTGTKGYVKQVSCVSTSFCVAVGNDSDPLGNRQPTINMWNGTTWNDRVVGLGLNGGGANVATLQSVKCISATFCSAGGYIEDSSQKTQGFVTTWNGTTWTDSEVGASLNTGGSAQIVQVSCTSAAFCMAVGYYTNSGQLGFSSTWNGTTWSDASLISVLPTGGLNSVSCTSPKFCVATGSATTAILAWNGSTWSSTSPSMSALGQGSGNGTAVACVNPSFCVVGGAFYVYVAGVAVGRQVYLAMWNGSTWTVSQDASSLNTESVAKPGLALINGISCVNMSFCVVSGQYLDANVVRQAYVSIWNGTTWTDTEIGASFSSVGTYSQVWSTSCISTTFCIGGATFGIATGQIEAATLQYNGSTWTITPVGLEYLTQPYEFLYSVSCVSTTFCVAGGRYTDNASASQGFVSMYEPMYPVSFSANGGTVLSTTQVTAPQGAIETLPAAPTKAGYIFSGWSDGTNLYQPGDAYTVGAAAVNFIAIWSVTQVNLPSAIPTGAALAPVSSQVSQTSSTNVVVSGQTVSSALLIPAGVLPAGTTVTATALTNPNAVAPPTGQVSVASIVVVWQAPDGSSPDATAPLTLTITNVAIKAGDSIYEIVGSTATLLGTATQDGSATVSFISDPVIEVTQPNPPVVYSKPSVPSNVTAVLNGNEALVSFSSGSNGNLATNYQVDEYVSGVDSGEVCSLTLTSSCTVGFLGANVPVAFKVIASNSLGVATSDLSNIVTYVVAIPKTNPTPTPTPTTPAAPSRTPTSCVTTKGKSTTKSKSTSCTKTK